MQLTILHTNDVHANYEPWLRCAAFIKARRAELSGQACLYVDCGDHFDLSVDVCGLTGGRLHLDLLGDAGLDAFVPGNNEFYRASRADLSRLSLASPFPWVLSTVGEAVGGTFGGIHQALLLDRGLPIGILGALAPMDGAAESLHGLSSLDLAGTLKARAQELRDRGAALVILLSHCGLEEDKALAAGTEGLVDLIIGGHSHSTLEEVLLVGDTRIVQAGGLGKFVGELRLEFGAGRPEILDYRLHPVEALPGPDPVQAAILDRHQKATTSFLGRELCVLPRAVAREEVLALSAGILKEKFGADLGLSFGPAATAGLPAGPLSLGGLYGICRSFLTPASFELRGSQLARLVRESQDPALAEQRGFGIGFRPQGLAFGKLVFSGLSWEGEAREARSISVGGRALDGDAWYSVGSLTHLYDASGGGHPSLDGSRKLQAQNFHNLREDLAAWFALNGSVEANWA